MEQVRLITASTIDDLEDKINEFMSKLDEDTDVVDVNVDSEYKDRDNFGNVKAWPYLLLATIRFATYTIDDPEPEDYIPPDPTQALLDSL